jgi:hypothetical protein
VQPEIFIPLGHLTTTLEVLGNILFMRDRIHEAQHSLGESPPVTGVVVAPPKSLLITSALQCLFDILTLSLLL